MVTAIIALLAFICGALCGLLVKIVIKVRDFDDEFTGDQL